MNKPEYFEILEGHSVFRPTGRLSFEQMVQLVASAVVFAREQKIRKLLVVITELTGFESPGVTARYLAMRDWVDAAKGEVCVAMVAKPEMIDFDKIGAVAGQNAGFRCNIFASEADAIIWLMNVQYVSEGDTTRFFRRRVSPRRS